MEVFYFIVFGTLAVIVAGVELSKSSKDRINTSSSFNSFKNNYLLVFSLMMGTLSLSLFMYHCIFNGIFRFLIWVFEFVCLIVLSDEKDWNFLAKIEFLWWLEDGDV